MPYSGIPFNPSENIYVVATADDLPDILSRYVIYNCLYDPGQGIGLYYTSDGATLTRVGQSPAQPEEGRPTITATGYQAVKDMFDVDPTASGTTYYFDPEATGANDGTSPSDAFSTFAAVNAKSFSTSDNLLFRAASYFIADEKFRNTSCVGAYQAPFYVGVYRLENGSPVVGRGTLDRPRIYGIDESDFNPYSGMTNGQLMSMIPTPEDSGGTFSQGSLEGIFNWYLNTDYDLYLWVDGLEVGKSGGRAFRFSQSSGGRATGLYVTDVLINGTLKHGLHLTGVQDFIIENVGQTLTSAEIHYWNPSSNRQASLATKGDQSDFDTDQNGWFVQCYVWDGFSSEGINTNSGCIANAIVDCVVVDQGLYGLYIDRTRNALVERNVLIRTSRTNFKDYTGIGNTNGRGVCAIMLQNEKSTGSFPWNVYNDEAGFNTYSTHDVVVRNNFAAGWSTSWGFQSQASSASGEVHTGRDFGPYCYWYGNVSLNVFVAHHMFDTFNQAPNYNITTTNPPRFWGGVYMDDKDMSTDNPTDIGDLFDSNYFDFTPETEYNTNAIQGGLVMQPTNWDDLSYLMDTDADGHMNEAQFLAFRDEVYSRLKPTSSIPSSGKALSAFTIPAAYDMDVAGGVDFDGNAYGTTRTVGAYAE